MRHCISLFLFFYLPLFTYGQTVCDLASRKRIADIGASFFESTPANLPIGELIISVGNQFLGTPYVEKTLELPGQEQVVINLMGLDCTTFVESVLALSISLKLGESSVEQVASTLESLRYLNGKNSGYASRLHYFSDWIFENEQAGRLVHLSQPLGGILSPNKPSFMSANPNSYPQLTNLEHLAAIRERETLLSSRDTYFIPKEKIRLIEDQLQNGDLIAITTPIKTLDVVHVGIAVKQGGRIHLMHASSLSKKVEISSLPLPEFLMNNRSQTGILVSRLVDFSPIDME